MRFCVISPAAGLEQFAKLSKTHLVLSQVNNPLYWRFYRERSDSGDLIILDNGAYERKLDERLLLLRAAEIRPKCIVLPDILGGDTRESTELSLKFFKEFRSRIDTEWMFVPQTNDGGRENLVQIHDSIRRASEEGISWFGIPRILSTKFFFSRPGLVDYIKRHCKPGCYTHALGMVAGDLGELEALYDVNCDSIDSSAPVWRGWNGYELVSDDEHWEKFGSDVDFNVHPNTLNEGRAKLIRKNLRKVGVHA